MFPDLPSPRRRSQQETLAMAAGMLEEQRGILSRGVQANRLLIDVASIGEDFGESPPFPSATT